MLSKEEVQHIANLARIKLTEDEIEKFQQDLSEILDYFAVLKDADTSKVEATTHSIMLENVQREDKAFPSNPKLVEKLITLFPAAKEGFLKVKAVFSPK